MERVDLNMPRLSPQDLYNHQSTNIGIVIAKAWISNLIWNYVLFFSWTETKNSKLVSFCSSVLESFLVITLS